MLIRRVLGPTALESAAVPAPSEPPGSATPAPAQTGGNGIGKLRLLDHDLGAGSGTGGLQLGGDTPKLRLREPGQRLELDHR